MLKKTIVFFGQQRVLACDGQCDKAWGINGRPRLFFMEEGKPARTLKQGEDAKNEDDYVYEGDDELGTAPGPGETVGISEGSDCKPSKTPLKDPLMLNRWCARECERSELFGPGQPIKIRDLKKPRPNNGSRVG